jgi:hypothetical protein
MRLARLRFIVFVPPAMLVAFGVLVSASSFVSTLETSLVSVSDPIYHVEFRRIDSGCDPVSRTLQGLSHAMMGCPTGSECSSRKILCPGTVEPAATQPASSESTLSESILSEGVIEVEMGDPSPTVFVF